jgi:hypothetical protein
MVDVIDICWLSVSPSYYTNTLKKQKSKAIFI